MKEITRYQASWGAWYVQVLTDDGQRIELKFDHEPKLEEVEKVALSIPKYEAVKQPVMVELTVDNSIAFLKERLAVAEPVEVAKITEFTKTAPADEVKPIPIEPIKVVK